MYLRRKTCATVKQILTMIVVLPVIWTGGWLSHQSTTECETHLNTPFLVTGIFLFVQSLVLYKRSGYSNNGIATNCIRFLKLVLFFVLLGYTVFALVATTTTAAAGNDEYGKYSKSLRNLVLDSFHWGHIKDCFVSKTELCSSFPDVIHNNTYHHFQSTNFDSLQYGCCTPLKACNITNDDGNNPKPKNGTADCEAWNDDPSILCFNCESCKVGFLHDIRTTWKTAATVNILVIFSLFLLFWCGDCGPDPTEEDDYYYNLIRDIPDDGLLVRRFWARPNQQNLSPAQRFAPLFMIDPSDQYQAFYNILQ